jgi:glutaconate CoA-transferase, subunit A
VPRGAAPSYAHGYYDRDNEFYKQWEEISRDRGTFAQWLDDHVYAAVTA